jgi:hypothetical protein
MGLVIIFIICIILLLYLLSSTFSRKSTYASFPEDFVCNGVWDTEDGSQFCSDKCSGAFISHRFNIATPYKEEWGIGSVGDYMNSCLRAARDATHTNPEWQNTGLNLDGNFIISKTSTQCNQGFPVHCPDHTTQESIHIRPPIDTCTGFWEYDMSEKDPKNPGDYTFKCSFFCDSEEHKSYKLLKFTITSSDSTIDSCHTEAAQQLNQPLYQNLGYEIDQQNPLKAVGNERCTFMRNCGKICTLINYIPDTQIEATVAECKSGLSTGTYGFSFDLDGPGDPRYLDCGSLKGTQPIDRSTVTQLNIRNNTEITTAGCPSDAWLRLNDPGHDTEYNYYHGAFIPESMNNTICIVPPNQSPSDDFIFKNLKRQITNLIFVEEGGVYRVAVFNKSTIGWAWRRFDPRFDRSGRWIMWLFDEDTKTGDINNSTVLWNIIENIKNGSSYKKLTIYIDQHTYPQAMPCKLVLAGNIDNPLNDTSLDPNYHDENFIYTKYDLFPSRSRLPTEYTFHMKLVPLVSNQEVAQFHRCIAGYTPKLGDGNAIECFPDRYYYDVCNNLNNDTKPDCCGTQLCSPFCSDQGSACHNKTGSELRLCLERYYEFTASGKQSCEAEDPDAWGPKMEAPTGANGVVYLIYDIPNRDNSNLFLYLYIVQYELTGILYFDYIAHLPDSTVIKLEKKSLDDLKNLIRLHTNVRTLEAQYVLWNRETIWPS